MAEHDRNLNPEGGEGDTGPPGLPALAPLGSGAQGPGNPPLVPALEVTHLIPSPGTPSPTGPTPSPTPSTQPSRLSVEPSRTVPLGAPEPTVRPPAVVPSKQPSIRGYDLLGPLGKGTFGSVWRARQVRTGALVAVKFFDRDVGMDWDLLRREIQCLLLIAKHPHVVTLLDADFVQKPPFMVMELMEGSLEHEIKKVRRGTTREPVVDEAEFPWTPYPDVPTAMRWFEEMSRGLLYVHGKAFLHCDLKPANVLLDDQRHVRIVDFGQSIVRGTRKLSMGTLFYMPPEQAEGVEQKEQVHPDVRWDIYAVGATAYMLLTGRPPRSGRKQLEHIRTAETVVSRLQIYRHLMAQTPLVPLRQINPAIPADFASIVEKCLQVDPNSRYETVTGILDDLDRMRRNEPLLCHRPWKASYLFRLFVRRNALWLVPLLALVAVLGISLFQMSRKIMKQNRFVITQMHRDGAETVTEYFSDDKNEGLFEAELNTYVTDLQGAREAIEQGDVKRAQILLEACQPSMRGWEWGYVRALVQRLETSARTGTAPGSAAKASPPAPDALAPERVQGLPRTSGRVQVLPNGSLMIVSRDVGEAEAVRTQDGKLDPDYLDTGGALFRSIAVGSDGKTGIFLRATGEILIRRRTDLQIKPLGVHPGACAVALSPDLRRAATVDESGRLKLWVLRNGREIFALDAAPPKPIALEFSSQGNKIIVYHDDDSATLFKALTWIEP